MIKKNRKILVSIIVPIYNVEKYLDRCIESIINQDYENIEILLVNDGSPDNSLSICEKYKNNDKRVIVINKKNGGVSSARNAGLKKAVGKYIIFVDADDWLDRDFVTYMVSLIENDDCDFALSTNCYKYNHDYNKQKDKIEILNTIDATALIVSTRLDIGCWNKIYKRSLINKNKLRFNEKLFFGEGLHFITMYSQLVNKAAVGQKKVYHYRQDNDTSATKKYNYEKYINGEKSLNFIKKQLILKDEKILEQLNIHYFYFFFNAVLTACVNNQIEIHNKKFNYWRKNTLKYYKLVKKSHQIPYFTKKKMLFIVKYPKLFMFVRKVKFLI